MTKESEWPGVEESLCWQDNLKPFESGRASHWPHGRLMVKETGNVVHVSRKDSQLYPEGRGLDFRAKRFEERSSNSNKRSARPGAQTPEGCSVYSTTCSLLSFLLFFGGAAREMLNHSLRLSPRRRKTKERGFERDFYKQGTPPGFALALRWLLWGNANTFNSRKTRPIEVMDQ